MFIIMEVTIYQSKWYLCVPPAIKGLIEYRTEEFEISILHERQSLAGLLEMFVILQYFNRISLPKCNVKLQSIEVLHEKNSTINFKELFKS